MRILSDYVSSEPSLPPASVAAFCAQTTPYLPEADTEAAFVVAMADITRWHQQRSPWYRAFLAASGIDPAQLRTLQDVMALPPIHANFFKTHEVLSIPESEISTHLTSSGTTGQKSQMFFDDFTLGSARRMVDDVMAARGMVSTTPANYVINGYEPFDGQKIGTANTNQFLMRYAPPAKVFWSLRALGPGQHEFDAFGVLAALADYANDSVPTRIAGFPAFLHFALQRMAQSGMAPLKLPPGSAIIFGGGWKGHADKAISREQLQRDITHWLGIPSEQIVETFGSVEHSIPYTGCHQQHLHALMWSRVVVRDVRTLEPLPDGQPGFLSFLSPYITSVPAHSVVMGDLAVRHPAGSCSCGLPTPWFEVLGRAGTSSNKSCAAAASDPLPPN